VFGTSGPVAQKPLLQSSARLEFRVFPDLHQAKYAGANSPFSGSVSFEQMQFLEPLEDPEGEINLNSRGIQYANIRLFIQRFGHMPTPMLKMRNHQSPITNNQLSFFNYSIRRKKNWLLVIGYLLF
jgi:hypothetical protein